MLFTHESRASTSTEACRQRSRSKGTKKFGKNVSFQLKIFKKEQKSLKYRRSTHTIGTSIKLHLKP